MNRDLKREGFALHSLRHSEGVRALWVGDGGWQAGLRDLVQGWVPRAWGPSEVCIWGRSYRWLSTELAATLRYWVPEELPPQLQGWRKGRNGWRKVDVVGVSSLEGFHSY